MREGSSSNRYEILTKLVEGGMSSIFLARNATGAGVQRIVVLKRVIAALANNRELVEMFVHEARLAAQLQHPNIAQVYDVGKLGNSYFFAMEYVHGRTIRDVMLRARETRTPVPVANVLTIAAGIAAGLHHAHERRGIDGKPLGIVHSDVSPTNVLISAEGVVKLVDFGIARAATGPQPNGRLLGKISYLSPEQCHSIGSVDRRTDLFSLGIVMWELLTLYSLYRRVNPHETTQAIEQEPPSPPSRVRPDIPAAVDEIVLKLLAKDPRDRYQTAAELLEAIEQVAHEQRVMLSVANLAKMMHGYFGQVAEPWLAQSETGASRLIIASEPVPQRWSMTAAGEIDEKLRALSPVTPAPGDLPGTDTIPERRFSVEISAELLADQAATASANPAATGPATAKPTTAKPATTSSAPPHRAKPPTANPANRANPASANPATANPATANPAAARLASMTAPAPRPNAAGQVITPAPLPAPPVAGPARPAQPAAARSQRATQQGFQPGAAPLAQPNTQQGLQALPRAQAQSQSAAGASPPAVAQNGSSRAQQPGAPAAASEKGPSSMQPKGPPGGQPPGPSNLPQLKPAQSGTLQSHSTVPPGARVMTPAQGAPQQPHPFAAQPGAQSSQPFAAQSRMPTAPPGQFVAESRANTPAQGAPAHASQPFVAQSRAQTSPPGAQSSGQFVAQSRMQTAPPGQFVAESRANTPAQGAPAASQQFVAQSRMPTSPPGAQSSQQFVAQSRMPTAPPGQFVVESRHTPAQGAPVVAQSRMQTPASGTPALVEGIRDPNAPRKNDGNATMLVDRKSDPSLAKVDAIVKARRAADPNATLMVDPLPPGAAARKKSKLPLLLGATVVCVAGVVIAIIAMGHRGASNDDANAAAKAPTPTQNAGATKDTASGSAGVTTPATGSATETTPATGSAAATTPGTASAAATTPATSSAAATPPKGTPTGASGSAATTDTTAHHHHHDTSDTTAAADKPAADDAKKPDSGSKITKLFEAGSYGDAVLACVNGAKSSDYPNCVVAACQIHDGAHANKWLAKSPASQREMIVQKCRYVGMNLVMPKSAQSDCSTDPDACLQ